MRVIAEQGSVDYYLHSAIVSIEEAKKDNFDYNIKRAIQLLALAKVHKDV